MNGILGLVVLAALLTACASTPEEAVQGGSGGSMAGAPSAGGSSVGGFGAANSGGVPGEAGGTGLGGTGGVLNPSGGIGGGPSGGAGGVGGPSGGTAGASGGAGMAGLGGGAGTAGAATFDECAGAPAPDPALLAKCSGAPTTCVLGGEAGHYDVTLRIGGTSASSTAVSAESRRLLLAETATAAGSSRCLSFTVNVRAPEGQPIQAGSPAGTNGLNLRITGTAPRLEGIGVALATNPIVLYLAGDSTVCDQDPQYESAPDGRFTGWGQMLTQFFRRGVSVTNYADSGEGTAAFRTDGGALWGRIAAGLKAGDFVFIQLGHNDKATPAATYRSRIVGMVRATKTAGATPVLISPMVRVDGTALSGQHIYGDLNVRSELSQIATTEQVAFVDLMEKSAAWVQSIGTQTARGHFVDVTHSNERGAQRLAELVVEGVREKVPSLAARLR